MTASSNNSSVLLSDPRVQRLQEIFAPHAELFLVGGCVRDFLLGKGIKDLDLTTVLETQAVLDILAKADIRSLETGARHGTVTAVLDGSNVEITTFRGPKSEGQTVEEALLSDLSLRDFTINAIALSATDGRLFDPLSGASDLERKQLASPQPAEERFRDDPLRILRMIRFGPAQNFSIEEKTYEAACNLLPLLSHVSIERIQREFSGILVSENPRAALETMLRCGLVDLLFPEALASVGFEQNDFHNEDVFQHTLSVVANTPQDLTLRLAAFFHDLGKPATLSVGDDGKRHFYEHELVSFDICESVMERLRYSKDLTKAVGKVVRYHMRPVDCGPAGVRRLMRDLGEQFVDWRKFKEADHPPVVSLDETKKELSVFDNKVAAEIQRAELEKRKRLSIDGYELMNLGFEAGPQLGKVIKQLEEEVIDEPERNSPEYLLARAKQLLAEYSNS